MQELKGSNETGSVQEVVGPLNTAQTLMAAPIQRNHNIHTQVGVADSRMLSNACRPNLWHQAKKLTP